MAILLSSETVSKLIDFDNRASDMIIFDILTVDGDAARLCMATTWKLPNKRSHEVRSKELGMISFG